MKRTIKLVLAVVITFLISIFLVSPASADTVTFDGDHSCPSLYPIKTQVVDVLANTNKTVCLTQYEWDIQMVGGETHAKWLASGGTYDATQDIANWRAERVAIEKLRTDAEAAMNAEAHAHPNTYVCKAYNYTSTYNGSGGGSFCTVYTPTVDVSVPASAPAPSDVISAAAVTTQSVAAQSFVAAVAPATKVTKSYFAATTKATQRLKKMTYTFGKAPKGSTVSITKTSGDSCFINGRTLYLGKNSSCSVAVTVTKSGAVQGTQIYNFVR